MSALNDAQGLAILVDHCKRKHPAPCTFSLHMSPTTLRAAVLALGKYQLPDSEVSVHEPFRICDVEVETNHGCAPGVVVLIRDMPDADPYTQPIREVWAARYYAGLC